MPGVAIQVKIKDEELNAMFQRIQRRMGNLKPAMSIVGEIVRTSIVRNFEVGGRPRRWKPLSRVTLAKRKGKKVLMRQGFAGGLAGSIKWRAYEDRAVIGTNKVYAAVHQFGAKKGSFGEFAVKIRSHMRKLKSGKTVRVREHTRRVRLPWGDIPARPYMLVQDEDLGEIGDALAGFILGGST